MILIAINEDGNIDKVMIVILIAMTIVTAIAMLISIVTPIVILILTSMAKQLAALYPPMQADSGIEK